MQSLLLSVEDIRSVVRAVGPDRLMDDVIDGVRQLCFEYRTSGCESPPRSGFQYVTPAVGLLEWMPFMDGSGRITIKIVGYHPENPTRHGIPTILSTFGSYDTRTGHMTAMMDGTFLTAVRTGAASAVASTILADPESRTIGLVGCGAQAVTQLHALSRAFPIKRALLFDTDRAVQDEYPRRVCSLGLGHIDYVAADPRQIAEESDIVCTQTSVAVGGGPVIEDVGLRASVHINAVGADLPGKTELPSSLVHRAFVCADFREQALAEGECQQLDPAEIGAGLAELVENADHYRPLRNQVTIFDSTGWSLEDHAALAVLIRHAEPLGVGTPTEFMGSSLDPWDPYAFLSEADASDKRLRLASPTRARKIR